MEANQQLTGVTCAELAVGFKSHKTGQKHSGRELRKMDSTPALTIYPAQVRSAGQSGVLQTATVPGRAPKVFGSWQSAAQNLGIYYI